MPIILIGINWKIFCRGNKPFCGRATFNLHLSPWGTTRVGRTRWRKRWSR